MTRLPAPPPQRDLAQQLRDAIRSSGRSQHELAKASGVNAGVISRFLGGTDVLMGTAGRIAAVLGVRLVEVGRQVRRGRPPKAGRPGLPDPQTHDWSQTYSGEADDGEPVQP